MIRPYRTEDLEQVIALWFETTVAAHPFIDVDYWLSVKPLVEQDYLPAAQTWVYEAGQEICGFVSVLEGKLIGALFVKPERQGTGVGEALIRYVQLRYRLLLLEVYPQNTRAYRFYQKMGFVAVSRELNHDTGAILETMCYRAV